MKPAVRNALLLLIVALIAGTAGVYVASTREPPPPGAGAPPAQLLALRLPDLENTIQPLGQWKGKVLVVNFWATWCPPCLKEIPEFVSASEKFRGADVQFVGISIDSPDKVRTFRSEQKVNYPLLIGTFDTLEVADGIGNKARALPFTVILDRGGNLHYVKLGTLTAPQLDERIRDALGKGAGK